MKAEIITSGTELLLGELADTNTHFIAGQLAALGIDLYYTSAVGDNFRRYSALLRQAWDRSDIVFTTGGLGPTQGDITREVIAGLLGEKMAVVPALKKELVALFTRRGIEMPENNFKQATLIPSATALRNECGTAPGWWVEKEGRVIVALPGPPIELQDMWRREVLPRLEAKSGAVILSRTLKCWGISESRIDELLSPFLGESDPTLGIYAKYDGIHLRITAKGTSSEAAAKVAGREAEIRGILDSHIWGADGDTLEGAAGGILAERGLTLACAETFTMGLLAQSIAGSPPGSQRFRGGVIVPELTEEGSIAGTLERAAAARRQFSADVGLAIGGGGEGGKVYIAVVSDERQQAVEASFPGGPQQVVRRAVSHALVILRDFLSAGE